jgi:transcriptional regulator with XRE-family HTH domain
VGEIFSFGDWVRRRRKALDLTQAALAQRVGCAVITIQKIEADERRPSRQIAERLADQLAIWRWRRQPRPHCEGRNSWCG